jgi:hypothetical protein
MEKSLRLIYRLEKLSRKMYVTKKVNPKKVKTKKISRLPLLYIMESGSVSIIISTRCRFFMSI